MQKTIGEWFGRATGATVSPDALLSNHLQTLTKVKRPPRVSLEEMIEKSEQFPGRFPINTARLVTLQANHDKDKLEEYINSAYPLVHERVLPLMAYFLQHKSVHGTRKERKLFKKLDLLGLVDRLMKKRPLMFVNSEDRYLLRDDDLDLGGWDTIGTDNEKEGLTLSDYMCYDEMKIAALMCASSQSVFINEGSRKNRGVPGEAGTFQPDGVIVGMVGARLHRPGVMEWQDCVITPVQNTEENGYSKDPPVHLGLRQEWGRMWGSTLPSWEEAVASTGDTYLTLNEEIKFNPEVYKSRIQMSAEILLAEAEERAKAVNLKAYIHVVGLGLGVWRLFAAMEKIFMEAWGNALKVRDYPLVGHVNFSWINASTCHNVGDGMVFPGTNITLHFSSRSLHDPVPPDTLLVCNFAWDGNSMPGNEYWMGSLTSSGDPAAACSSQVAELHNALINPRLAATNLHVVSSNGVEHVSEYARRKLQEDK